MDLYLKKNQAAEIMIPMKDSASPASFKSGLTVTDAAFYKDGAAAWTALGITDVFTEIGTIGYYTIELAAAEMNHDLIVIKLTASGAADNGINIRTFDVDIEDLVRSTTPANTLDIEAGGTVGLDFSNTNGTHPTVGTVTNVTNDVGITQAGADKVWSSATKTLTAGTKDTEIDAIKVKTDNLPADTGALLNRIAGLEKENYYLDTTTYSSGQLTAGRIRIYSDAASVGTDNNVIATYQVTGVYSSGQLTSYKVAKQ